MELSKRNYIDYETCLSYYSIVCMVMQRREVMS